MKKLASQVFGISNTVVVDSYVDRGALDEEIQRHLARKTHIALRGESKCGKSWLRQSVLPSALVVQCRLDRGVNDVYVDALSQLDIKLELDRTSLGKVSGRLEAQGEIGEGLLAKVFGLKARVEAEGAAEASSGTRAAPAGRDINDLRYVADLIRASGRRLVVEDFHYLSIDERKKFSFDLKALWDYGVFVLIIGVWSQSNMLIFLNPDLTGRIEELSIYWSAADLGRVLRKGGASLNLSFSEDFRDACVRDCYGNVGIFQTLVIRALDILKIEEEQTEDLLVADLDALRSAALQYADQLNALYQQFAQRVSAGIRSRNDSTGIYAHAMAVILEASDEDAVKGIPLDYIFAKAHSRQPRIQKGNLKTILERFESLQVDSEGRGLVLSYNTATSEVSVVDRQILLYRKYLTVKWPWEDLIAEAMSQED